MEERAVEEKERAEARDRVRLQLANAERMAVRIAENDETLADLPPHLLGR